MAASIRMKLPFVLRGREQLEWWADRYPKFEKNRDRRLSHLVKTAKGEKGYLTLNEMKQLAYWKSGKRTFTDLDDNKLGEIERLTEAALKDDGDMEYLLSIDGVGIATASTLMHFAFPERYPIIDRLALFTLTGKEQYATPALWEAYVPKCLDMKTCYELSLRTIDRALWVYGSEGLAWKKQEEVEELKE